MKVQKHFSPHFENVYSICQSASISYEHEYMVVSMMHSQQQTVDDNTSE